VFSGCTSFRVYTSWFYYSCNSIGLSILDPSDVGCWVSTTTGVGFSGFVFGDGILSTLMTSSGCCSLSSNYTRDLILTLVGLTLWLVYSFFGGAMVVNVKHLLILNGLYDLYELCSMLLSVYHSLSVLFSQMNYFFLRRCVVWVSHESCRGRFLNCGFNAPSILLFFLLLYVAISSWHD
jgi:hypothetical protein